MEKIVVLNSGGFDSTTLLADLASYKKYEIHSLYFDYGQLNSLYDSKCAKDNADNLGAIHHEVNLPKFEWSKSSFYEEDSNEYKSQYLEMRNVIFISYALSLAESIGATSIYAAILGNGNYKDTSAPFLERMKSLCEVLGVSFETPYAQFEKPDLFYIAKKLGVGTKLPYFSCDTPKNGNPCKKCLDCKSLEDYEFIIHNKFAVHHFVESGFDADNKDFKTAFMKEPINEMRVVLNNSCQLHCEHCYHGDNKLIDDILTDEELVDAIVEAESIGIKSIHFAGKEPLYDDRIFRIINLVKDKGVNDLDFSVVTNAINVPKYAEQIKNSGISKVFLSADDEYSGGEHDIRHNAVNAAVKRAILALNGVVPVEIFFDLTPYSIKNVLSNIAYWETWGVDSFHIRTIRPVGNAEDNIDYLTVEELCTLHKELKNFKDDIAIELDIGAAPYTYDIIMSEEECTSEIKQDLDGLMTLETTYINDNYRLFMELFCNRYHSQITLTADGYVLGCAMECSVADYTKTSSGSIRSNSLSYLIQEGKKQSLEVNKKQCNKNCINFEKCIFTPIDF